MALLWLPFVRQTYLRHHRYAFFDLGYEVLSLLALHFAEPQIEAGRRRELNTTSPSGLVQLRQTPSALPHSDKCKRLSPEEKADSGDARPCPRITRVSVTTRLGVNRSSD